MQRSLNKSSKAIKYLSKKLSHVLMIKQTSKLKIAKSFLVKHLKESKGSNKVKVQNNVSIST